MIARNFEGKNQSVPLIHFLSPNTHTQAQKNLLAKPRRQKYVLEKFAKYSGLESQG